MNQKHICVAIDGPSGAGKSTLARMIAGALGYIYVDTGAIYRSVGLCALRGGISSKDEAGVSALLDGITLKLEYGADGAQHMILNGEDITGEIRRPEVSIYASDVSAMLPVRAFLLDMQRDMAKRHDVVMDGRDIGTVVLPNADVKIFLTASVEERARRRHEEQLIRGMESRLEDVLEQINYRDVNDSTREAAPLKAAEDAILVETTGNSIEKSFTFLLQLIKEKIGI